MKKIGPFIVNEISKIHMIENVIFISLESSLLDDSGSTYIAQIFNMISPRKMLIHYEKYPFIRTSPLRVTFFLLVQEEIPWNQMKWSLKASENPPKMTLDLILNLE